MVARGHSCRCYRKLRKLIDSLESQEAMSDANGDADTGLPDNDIWFVLVDVNAATCCSTGDKAVTQDPSTEENEENKVATQDPYMTIPRKKRKKKKRSLTKKEKEKKSEKEKEKKAERSTVKMYYWNVALSEHCEDVPLESGSVHWSTAKMYHCEDAPLRSTAKMYHWNVALSTGALRRCTTAKM